MRARERYAQQGPDRFPDDELLALVIGLGDAQRSNLDIARDLLERFGDLRGALDAPVDGLMQVPGLGLARAVRVHAALHAGHRAARPRAVYSAPLASPQDIWDVLAPMMAGLLVEELHALYLDRRARLLNHRVLTRGSADGTVIDPRQVFRPAVQMGVASVIVAHNHPSGDPTPSTQDITATRRLVAAGRLIGIELVDHLIVGHESWVSLRAEGLLT